MSVGSELLSVLICRGCCCGTDEGIDHDAHLASLVAAVEQAGGRTRVTGCIGPCDRRNVVVVRSRRDSGRWFARYFGFVGQSGIDALCAWFADGKPSDPEPEVLATTRFDWPRPTRPATGDSAQ